MSSSISVSGNDLVGYIDDNGNRVLGQPAMVDRVSVLFAGRNCCVKFAPGTGFRGAIQLRGFGSSVDVGEGCNVIASVFVFGGGRLLVGARVGTSGMLLVSVADKATVDIGDGCLFAPGCELRAYDNHPIFDMESRVRLNYAQSINIGSEVWLGADVAVLGGARIGHGSIVGMRSVVTKSHPIGDHCLAVGSPAKVRRERVAWLREGVDPLDRLPDTWHSEC